MNIRSIWRPDRDEVVANNGVVTAMHPLAAEAGLEMLKRGGNAIDAAVATGFAISVVEPNNSSIAGVGFMLVHLESGAGQYPPGTDIVIEYGPRAPKAARAEMYKIIGPGAGISTYSVEGDENLEGYRSITLPGTAIGLCTAHKLMGKLPLDQVMEPAIHLAQYGFDVYWLLTLMIGGSMQGIQRFAASREVFLPQGYPPRYLPDPSSADQATDRLVQRDLAEVLKRISRFGSPGLYEGEIATAIEQDMKQNGGLITRLDLASYRPAVRTPLAVRFRDYKMLAPTAPCGSWTALETLNLLENFDLRSMGHNSINHLHTFIEGSRHSFADRYRYLGDPDFVDVPLNALLSKAYAREVVGQIDLSHACVEDLSEEQPWTYFEERALHDPWKHEGKVGPVPPLGPSLDTDADCTTHFGVADRDGNLVSCTQTAVSTFGSKVVTKGLGILWNNGMVWFNARPGAVNSIESWKRPLVNMAPLLVTRDGKGFLSVGSPGGRQVTNANTNVVLNVLEFGMGPQEAITSTRIDTAGAVNMADSRLDKGVVKALEQMGHSMHIVNDVDAWYSFARPSAIQIDERKGVLRAGTHVGGVAAVTGF